MKRIAHAMIFLILGCAAAAAQSETAPMLIDEFPRANCEDILSRMDALLINFSVRPESKAVIAIPESESEPLRNLNIESLIYGAIAVKRFGFDRIQIVRTVGSESSVRFWLIPLGADRPNVVETPWKLRLGLTRATLFFSDGPMFDAICSHGNVAKQFVDLLSANPSYRGHIVLRGANLNSLRKSVGEEAKALEPIPRSRLRFFFVREKEASFEYWLVPPKPGK